MARGLAPEGRKPMAWNEFVTAVMIEYPEEAHDKSQFDNRSDYEKQELMRVVRMVKQCHGIGIKNESI